MTDKIVIPKIILDLNLETNHPIYFKKETSIPRVHEFVNLILAPYGYEEFSVGQFQRIAGGSSNSSNRIKNYENGRAKVKEGFTYLKDIVDYCQKNLNNSVLVPLEDVINEFNWAKKAINEKYITLHSNGKMRYDIEAIMDITKGKLNEVAFKIDCGINKIDIKLDDDFYTGTGNTDKGQDVKSVRFSGGEFVVPKIKVQIKDAQYFLLISKNEFEGNRQAELFVGYKVHWKKATTGQRFFRSLGGRGEEIFSDFPVLSGIRVERRGWALREDFKELPSKKSFRGMSFNDNNMFIYWDSLRNMDELFPKLKSILT